MGKETAEQKLLKLIEATQKQDTKPAASSAAASAHVQEAQKVFQSVTGVGVTGVSIPPPVMQFFALLQGLTGQKSQGFGLREFNRIFIVGVGIFIIFFVADFMKSMERSKAELRLTLGQTLVTGVNAPGQIWIPVEKPFAEYAQALSQRNIFQPFERKAVVEKTAQTVEQAGLQRITDQVKDLKLVGISWLDSPESASAMIENTTSGTTYFLGVGDKIQNVMVKNIFMDSVVVGYENEELELKL